MQELLEAGVTKKQVEDLTNKLRIDGLTYFTTRFSLNDELKKVAQLSYQINQYETGAVDVLPLKRCWMTVWLMVYCLFQTWHAWPLLQRILNSLVVTGILSEDDKSN